MTATPQLELFAAGPPMPAAVPAQPMPSSLFERMSEIARAASAPPAVESAVGAAEAGRPTFGPGAREWAEGRIVAWTERAARARAGGGPAAERVASSLEWHVRRLRALHGIETAASAPSGGPVAVQLAALRKQLDGWQPRLDPKLGVMVNAGAITAGIRAEIEARIAALEGGG